jgi:uncharacterized protein YdaT
MPWTAESFKNKHNKHLNPSEAKHAAAQATAMVKNGVPEGEAIATANKHAHDKPKTHAQKLYPSHSKDKK